MLAAQPAQFGLQVGGPPLGFLAPALGFLLSVLGLLAPAIGFLLTPLGFALAIFGLLAQAMLLGLGRHGHPCPIVDP